jgi:hypothetical protein
MDHASGCSLIYQGLAGTKIRCLSFHPSRSWLAVGDDRGFLSIHEFQTSNILFRNQPDVAVDGRYGVSGVKPTAVRLVAFLDEEVSFWRGHRDYKSTDLSSTSQLSLYQSMRHKRFSRGTMVITVTSHAVYAVLCAASMQEVRTIRGLETKGLLAIDTVVLNQVRISPVTIFLPMILNRNSSRRIAVRTHSFASCRPPTAS